MTDETGTVVRFTMTCGTCGNRFGWVAKGGEPVGGVVTVHAVEAPNCPHCAIRALHASTPNHSA